MVESIESTMEKYKKEFRETLSQRLEIYNRFLAPWNIEKGERLRLSDKHLEKLWTMLLTLFAGVRDSDRDHMTWLNGEVETWKFRYEESQRLCAKAQKDYVELHESYAQLVHKVEMLEKDMAKMEIKDGTDGKSSKRVKKGKAKAL